MVLLRLRGGGGDGGVYPLTHAEMKWMTPSEMGTSGGGCNSNATKDKVSDGHARLDRVKVCAVSSKPLRAPIVVCDLGYMLNKEDAIEYILGKKLPPHMSHIRSLKSLHNATMHPNPAFKESSSHVQGAEDDEPPFYCPVAMLPMNGRYPFVYIKPTRHVVSQRALKQVSSSVCPVTEQPITPEDVIPIYPADDERKAMTDRLTAKRASAAEGKRKAKGQGSTAVSAANVSGEQLEASAGGSTSKATAGAAATAMPTGARPGAPHANVDLAKPSGTKRSQREWENGAREAVEAKAKTSDVYKSLFISAEERKRMEKSESANFCARGIVPSLSRSTKFGLG